MGFVHGELTSLLWGGAFGFAWSYVQVARALVARHPTVRNPLGRLEPLVPGGLTFRTAQPPPTPAFFHWTLVVEGRHSPSRAFIRTRGLEAVSELPLDLPRGRYEVSARWEMHDLLGFSRLVPPARWTASMTVEPPALPFSPPPPPATKAGPWRPRRAGRRTGDPFDVRPYLPGDDLRRLHWPLFAHSGTAFVRTAEPSPPPTGHQFLVLDTEAASEEVLDDRIGRLVTWLRLLDGQNAGWTLAIPSAGVTLNASPGTALAGLTPAEFPEALGEAGWPEAVTLVTGPKSRGAEALARRLAASRRRCRPVVVPVPPVPQPPSPPWWSR